MKRSIILTFLIILSLTFTSCLNNKDDLEPIEVGTTAPDFQLQSLNGDEIKLSDFKNKLVVLFFFGNNCPTCKAAAPNIERMLVTPFASRTDYIVLGLDQWDGNTASVESFKKTTNVSFTLLLDASNVAAQYKTTYDRLIVINKEGNIVFSGTQGAAADIESVKEKVDELLAE